MKNKNSIQDEKHNDFNSDVARLSHHLVQLQREDFRLDHSKWMPLYQQDDAAVMCPPFVGKNYKKGGMLIMPINPGGGNVTHNKRNYGDQLLYPIVHAFKSMKEDVVDFYWKEFESVFRRAKPTWPIYKKMEPILLAAAILASFDNFHWVYAFMLLEIILRSSTM